MCERALFPKSIRLLKRHQYKRLIPPETRTIGDFLIIDCSKNSLDCSRLGITASKHYGKSHDRNRFKRLVREAFRLSYPDLPQGLDFIIKPKGKAKPLSLSHIQTDMQTMMLQLKLEFIF